ncbi:MAG TPA: DNA-binding protein [Stellaceae bacterium]|jgi:putative transposase
MTLGSGEWLTAFELAPFMGMTERAVRNNALREQWTKRRRAGRGGGYEFHISSLPAAAREAIKHKRVEEARLALVLPATGEEIAVASQSRGEIVPLRPADEAPLAAQKLSEAQRATMDARLVLLREIDVIAAKENRTTAVRLLIAAAADKSLRPELLELVPIANARAGDGGRVVPRHDLQLAEAPR